MTQNLNIKAAAMEAAIERVIAADQAISSIITNNGLFQTVVLTEKNVHIITYASGSSYRADKIRIDTTPLGVTTQQVHRVFELVTEDGVIKG